MERSIFSFLPATCKFYSIPQFLQGRRWGVTIPCCRLSRWRSPSLFTHSLPESCSCQLLGTVTTLFLLLKFSDTSHQACGRLQQLRREKAPRSKMSLSFVLLNHGQVIKKITASFLSIVSCRKTLARHQNLI